MFTLICKKYAIFISNCLKHYKSCSTDLQISNICIFKKKRKKISARSTFRLPDTYLAEPISIATLPQE